MRRLTAICSIKLYSYEGYNSFSRLVQGVSLFRLALDAETAKDAPIHGLHLNYKKEEKDTITKEEPEDLFWSLKLLGLQQTFWFKKR